MYGEMVKFPYVLDYSLFTRVDIQVAEELLSEYNDFYAYNKAQFEDILKSEKPVETFHRQENVELTPEQAAELLKIQADRQKLIEHNVKVTTDHYAKLLGSKDFAESSMVGLKIAWYDLQQILLEEYKAKTSILESAMNEIAPRLRNFASLLLIAERVVHELEELTSDQTVIEPVKEGFELLLERFSEGELDLPEYHKIKMQFNKMKSIKSYIEFCEKIFFDRQER